MKENSLKLRGCFIKELSARGLTVAFAESMTCGFAMHRLSVVKGTLEVLRGGVVCYHENVKTDLLQVPHTAIVKHTAESQDVTIRLARSLRKLVKADIHVAITGLAAPGGSETKQKPVGTVFIAVLYRNKISTLRQVFNGSPRRVVEKACDETYRFILKVAAKGVKST